MAYVGSLQVIEDNNANGMKYDFINAHFPGGWPEHSIQRVGEPITAMGIDGTRARYTRQDYPQFVFQSIYENSSFPAAVLTVGLMRQERLKRATLSIITNGVTYDFGSLKAYIWAVAARPVRADLVTTNGVMVAPQGMVITDWTLQFIPT